MTHNSEDLAAYYARALPALRGLAGVTEVVHNPLERDLTTEELIAAAVGCEVIVAHRSTPGEAALFEAALYDVAVSLTRQIARDGEGATTLLQVTVDGAASGSAKASACSRSGFPGCLPRFF